MNKIIRTSLILMIIFILHTTDIIAVNTNGKRLQDNEHHEIKIVHTLVALCDNIHQGIVPVPAKIGNGDDLINNLYWGAGYGVKSYFKKLAQWELIADFKDPKPGVLERVVFKNRNKNVFLVADAYRGAEIKQCTSDLLEYAAGNKPEEIIVKVANRDLKLNIGGKADLITYTGHNGLMDFKLDRYPKRRDERNRDVIILACVSRNYFQIPLLATGANPILWTTGLMAPEAYVLAAAINSWMNNEGLSKMRVRAAEAYNRYQKCGIKGALNLFSSSR